MKLTKQPEERKEAAAMESKSAEITALTLSSCKSLLTDMYKTFEIKVSDSYLKYQKGVLVDEAIPPPQQVIDKFNIDLLIDMKKKGFD